jgi:ACDE family multidrug resistance protein
MTIAYPFALWILLASSTLTVMAGAIIAPVLNLMREGLGADPSSAAIIITTHGIMIALCSPLIGILIDRLGVKRPYVFGLVLYGLAGSSGLFINTYWIMIVSRVFLGIAVAAIFTSVTVTILNLYKGEERNKVMGWRGSFTSLGGLIWPLLGGFLGGFSWHLPFAVYLTGIPIGILAGLAIPEVQQEKVSDQGVGNPEKSVFEIFKTVPVLFVIYGLIFYLNVLLYTIVVFLPPLLEKIDISDPFYIGAYIAIGPVFGGTTAFFYGKIKQRLSYKTIIVLAMFLCALGFTTISWNPHALMIGASIALFGIAQGMLMPSILVWIGEAVPASFRGRITSYLGTFGFIGQFLSPIIFRPLVLIWGPQSVFFTAGLTSALLFFLFLVVMKKS